MDATGVSNLLQSLSDASIEMLECVDLQGRSASQAALLFFCLGAVAYTLAGYSSSNIPNQ